MNPGRSGQLTVKLSETYGCGKTASCRSGQLTVKLSETFGLECHLQILTHRYNRPLAAQSSETSMPRIAPSFC